MDARIYNDYFLPDYFLHDYCFFFQIRPLEELLDSKCSTLREELGRPTLRAFGGFLMTFFYQRRFGFTHEILLVIDKLQKLDSGSL